MAKPSCADVSNGNLFFLLKTFADGINAVEIYIVLNFLMLLSLYAELCIFSLTVLQCCNISVKFCACLGPHSPQWSGYGLLKELLNYLRDLCQGWGWGFKLHRTTQRTCCLGSGVPQSALFRRLRISPVRVSSSPPPAEHSLCRAMLSLPESVCQNFLAANWTPVSVASPNSTHPSRSHSGPPGTRPWLQENQKGLQFSQSLAHIEFPYNVLYKSNCLALPLLVWLKGRFTQKIEKKYFLTYL